MALKIRLRRMGRRNAPTYRIVVAESLMPRDGRIIENIGHYNPRTEPMTLVVDRQRALHWLERGAIPTETAHSLIKKSGVFRPEPTLVETVTEAAKDAAEAVADTAKKAAKAAKETGKKAAGAVKAAASEAVEAVTGEGEAPEATEATAPAEPTEPAEVTEPAEATAATEVTEATDTADAAPATEATEATDTADAAPATEAIEATDAADAAPVTEVTEPDAERAPAASAAEEVAAEDETKE